MWKLGMGRKIMERQVEEEAHQLVKIFASTKGQPFDPLPAITNSVCNMVCAVNFGYRFSLEDENFQILIKTIDFGTNFGSTYVFLLYELFPWIMKHLPGPHNKLLSLMEAVMSFIRQEIKRHKTHQNLHEPSDFIDFYLLQMEKVNSSTTSFDEENLAVSIAEFFIAGTETMSITLQWGLLLMVAYPEIQEKVYKEMTDVFGSLHYISYQDRKKLPYTNAVIHEIQRFRYILYTSIARYSVKDTEVLGIHVPKGTIILPDVSSAMFDPEQWETPEQFNPHHFLDKDGNFMPKDAFLPFGAGARVCLGEQLAKVELFLFFTSLLRAFTLQLPEGAGKPNLEPAIGVIVHPHAYQLCAIPRCNS
ncbi:cytochrome P450 2J4-like [Varanus komodoensis]|uniref:cytochrome P450 2J4-like n=1 Tax=Varanus komodoensis TaxID=61221 RepID=UPI001CF7D4A3|nr:cytochrome P450 2J4-like [Varanus komodoensis]